MIEDFLLNKIKHTWSHSPPK